MPDKQPEYSFSFKPKEMVIGAQMLFVAFGALVLVPLLTGLNANVALFTAGAGTLMDAMIRAAGLSNLTTAPGFGAISVEQIALQPPVRFVLGFFDMLRADWRGAGRHPVVQRAARGRTAARLPAAVLTCPAWFAAEGVAMMARRR